QINITNSLISLPGLNISYANIGALTVNSGAGNDIINVQSTISNLTIDTVAGSDRITLGDTNHNLDLITHTVTINGDGLDTLSLLDQANMNSDTWTFTSGSVMRGGFQVNLSGLQSVSASAGTGSSLFNIAGTGYALTLSTGPGDDRILAGNLAAI